MFKSNGTLKYSINPLKLIVEVDPEISKYYFSFIPKYLGANRPMWDAHISVVRNAFPPNMLMWGKYDGKDIHFEYDGLIYNDELYFWLNVWSIDLENIRKELGLKPFGDVSVSPDGKCAFHITIANLKNN